MNKSEMLNRAKANLDDLIEESAFFRVFLNSAGDFSPIDDDLCDYDNSDLHLYAGASRCCLVDDNDDEWVVKFDYWSPNGESACEREVEIYEAAEHASLNQYFSEVVYLGEYYKKFYSFSHDDFEDIFTNVYNAEDFDNWITDHPNAEDDTRYEFTCSLYAYRRAEQRVIAWNSSAADRKRANSISSPLLSRNINVAIAFINEYGWNEYVRFSEFGDEWEINDIHTGNIGTIDEHMVLIDYAGYHYDE